MQFPKLTLLRLIVKERLIFVDPSSAQKLNPWCTGTRCTNIFPSLKTLEIYFPELDDSEDSENEDNVGSTFLSLNSCRILPLLCSVPSIEVLSIASRRIPHFIPILQFIKHNESLITLPNLQYLYTGFGGNPNIIHGVLAESESESSNAESSATDFDLGRLVALKHRVRLIANGNLLDKATVISSIEQQLRDDHKLDVSFELMRSNGMNMHHCLISNIPYA
ncbi:hypothetical protein CVT24_009470 [Panaeolus cyanescens]|uniref:Uncharacterized protein n=1 Tax=Panaeolus cyanescens TaxID=181874 RepID=A0A409WTU6_9AGAR|nr:hypothetical protein CVT24_009470 [Panaeolus cyanescens]